ncbi:MAG: hypothetical protein QHI48_08505 [Bacteroidota bacterium]|nr:hypothetical protein [Bacteroidota bacterium]
MERQASLPFCTLLIVLSLVPTAAAQEYDLVYRFPKGKELRYKRVEKTTALGQTQTGLSADMDKTVETFFTLKPERAGDGNIVAVFLQDTAYVDDRSVSSTTMGTGAVNFDNVLTKKPVRLTFTAKGELRSAEPLLPLSLPGSVVPVQERALARQAMFLPVLPKHPVKIGGTWTDAASDTTYPKTNDPRLGPGEGMRISSVRTVYSVDSLVSLAGHTCLVINWKGSIRIESKMIYKGSENFAEEETNLTGTMYFAVREGILHRLVLSSKRESTTAIFATASEIIPLSFTSDITIELLPI